MAEFRGFGAIRDNARPGENPFLRGQENPTEFLTSRVDLSVQLRKPRLPRPKMDKLGRDAFAN